MNQQETLILKMQKVFELFKSLSNKGTTIVIATHNKDLAQMADKIYEVKDGQIK